ncbi:MAG: hypothetical protein KC619_34575 [Myxococcales bacterium]|nr:hypothetical protein [Myxococcales bacterium]
MRDHRRWKARLAGALVAALALLSDCSGHDYGYLFADAGPCPDAAADAACMP